MQNTIECLLSPDNAVRKEAEEKLRTESVSNPGQVAQSLLETIRSNRSEQESSMSCVLLKKFFLEQADSKISADDLEQMRSAIMESLNFSAGNNMVLKRKGELLSKIYAKQSKSEDLLKLLVQWATADDAASREFSMYVFEILSDIHLTSEQLTNYKSDFMQIFEKALQDREISVRVAALKAITAFFNGIDDQDVVLQFITIMPKLLDIVVETLKQNETHGLTALESMEDLTKNHPEIWKGNTAQLVNVISQVMQTKDFEEGTRAAAAEILAALSEQMPAALRKTDECKTMLFPALAQMLTEVEQDDQVWAETTDEDESLAKDPANTAVSIIGRISSDLGEKTTLAACQPLIGQMVKSENWVERQAGYTMLGLISEACRESLLKNMDEAMKMACAGMIDANVRVRYAGLTAIALLLTELAPKAQNTYHGELMPMLLKMMNNEETMKMQTQATSATLNFAKGFMEEDEESEQKSSTIMVGYSKDILLTLAALLKKGIQNNYEPLQSESMQLLSTLASVIQDEFKAYYNDFMPLMTEILTNVKGEDIEQKKLRAKAIETMGAMIDAVVEEQETFKASVVEITNHLSTLLKAGLTDDDPQDVAIKETLIIAAGFLQAEFGQFMPLLMETLVHDARLDLDIKMESADMPSQQNSGEAGITLKLKGMGEQRLTMNTDATSKKIGAFKLIEQVSSNMEKSFAPYVEPLMPIIKEHMTFEYSKEIKKAALKTFTNMLVAVGEPANIQLFQTAVPMYLQQIKTNLEKERYKAVKIYIKELGNALKALNKHNSQAREFLSMEQIQQLGPLMKGTLDLVTLLRNETQQGIAAAKKGFDMDEEDMDIIKEELAKVSRTSSYVMELSGQLVDIFKGAVEPVIKENCLNFYALALNGYKDLTEDELLDTMCFFCDFIEHASHSDANVMADLSVKFLEIAAANEENDDVLQTVIYGLGVFGFYLTQEQFAPFLAQIVNMIKAKISLPEAFDEDNIVASESSMGALAKLCYRQMDNKALTTADLVAVLSRMPYGAEETEAQTSHKILMEEFIAGNKVLAENKDAVKGALQKIAQHLDEQTEDSDVNVLRVQDRALLQQALSM